MRNLFFAATVAAALPFPALPSQFEKIASTAVAQTGKSKSKASALTPSSNLTALSSQVRTAFGFVDAGAVRRIFEPVIVANLAASTLAQCLTALPADQHAALSIR
jgi:hypothetical protein